LSTGTGYGRAGLVLGACSFDLAVVLATPTLDCSFPKYYPSVLDSFSSV